VRRLPDSSTSNWDTIRFCRIASLIIATSSANCPLPRPTLITVGVTYHLAIHFGYVTLISKEPVGWVLSNTRESIDDKSSPTLKKSILKCNVFVS